MDKDWATFRLGNTTEQAARWIGISADVYRLWPERLHPVMADRVYAAIIRRATAHALGMTAKQFFADVRSELCRGVGVRGGARSGGHRVGDDRPMVELRNVTGGTGR